MSKASTGFSSKIGTKLRESAVGQAVGSCYSQAALSSNDSKTLYGRGNVIIWGEYFTLHKGSFIEDVRTEGGGGLRNL